MGCDCGDAYSGSSFSYEADYGNGWGLERMAREQEKERLGVSSVSAWERAKDVMADFLFGPPEPPVVAPVAEGSGKPRRTKKKRMGPTVSWWNRGAYYTRWTTIIFPRKMRRLSAERYRADREFAEKHFGVHPSRIEEKELEVVDGYTL